MIVGILLFFLAFIGLMLTICFGMMFSELENDPLSNRITQIGILMAVVFGVLFLVVIL